MIAETVVDTTALLADLLASVGLAQPPDGEVRIPVGRLAARYRVVGLP